MTKHDTTHATDANLATQAQHALSTVKDLTGSLSIDDWLNPSELASTHVTRRVPLAAMKIVAGVLAKNPGQYPQFDAVAADEALAYEAAMTPVADAMVALAARLKKSILKRKAAMAHQTLAVYGVMKASARVSVTTEDALHMKELSELFTTRRASRDLAVTQKETDAMVRARKGAKKQAAAEAKVAAASSEVARATAQAEVDAMGSSETR